MATMYPRTLLTDEVKSSAELLVFEQLRDALDDEWEIFHSAGWVHRDHATGADDGEIDFVLAHPDEAIICLEVKGGDMECKYGEWRRKVNGLWERFKDPFAQALDHRYDLERLIDEQDGWRGKDLLIGHAIALPKMRVHQLALAPDAKRELLLDHHDVADIAPAISRVLQFHRGSRDRRKAPGAAGMDMLRELLAPTVRIEAPLAAQFHEEERALVELTRDQTAALKQLARNSHVAVLGCAGSGKTLLAAEHARRLAADGKRVAFVCFNRALAMHLKETATQEGIEYWTFHGLCVRQAALADIALPGADARLPEYWSDELPEALVDALDARGPQWDALVVDEAQDLRPHWLDALRSGLPDERTSPVWLFLDDNQRIYDSGFDVPDDFFFSELSTNCRTTQSIHRELLKLHSGPVAPDARGPEGRTPELVHATDQPAAVGELLDRLLGEDDVKPTDIAVLSAHGEKSEVLKALRQRLWTTADKKKPKPGQVRFSSIRAFKGLEAPVVVLCELEDLEESTRDQQLYVGLSRARNHCVIVAPASP